MWSILSSLGCRNVWDLNFVDSSQHNHFLGRRSFFKTGGGSAWFSWVWLLKLADILGIPQLEICSLQKLVSLWQSRRNLEVAKPLILYTVRQSNLQFIPVNVIICRCIWYIRLWCGKILSELGVVYSIIITIMVLPLLVKLFKYHVTLNTFIMNMNISWYLVQYAMWQRIQNMYRIMYLWMLH